jgi:hypothetical protein
MINFENIHKNHKLAYLDGLLCGVALTIIVNGFVKDYREMKLARRLMDETDTTTASK